MAAYRIEILPPVMNQRRRNSPGPIGFSPIVTLLRRMTRACKPAQPWRARRARLAGAGALLDNDDLPIAVVATVRADVMRAMKLPAGLTNDQLGALQENVAAAVALPVPANTLLW
jgi:hypothetical protein